MKTEFRSCVTVLLMALLIGISAVSGADDFQNPLLDLKMSPEQRLNFQDVFEEYSALQLELRGKRDIKMAELKLEMMKKDRFETKAKEKASVARINKIIRSISLLTGDAFKTMVVYLLKARDVFTEEQRDQMFTSLRDFSFQMPDDIFGVVEKELLNLDLGLTHEQAKKILKNRAKMAKNSIDLNLKSSLQIIDLQQEMARDKRDNEKINGIILKISELGTRQMDNRVVHFLKAKDVLTIEQRKTLFHAILMMPAY
jgi:hypothetical protein